MRSRFWQAFEKQAVTRGWIAERVERGLAGRDLKDPAQTMSELQKELGKGSSEDSLTSKSRKRFPSAARRERYQAMPKSERAKLRTDMRKLQKSFPKKESR